MAAPRSNRRTALALAGLVAAMGGLVVASAPLYRMFCRLTGAEGTPRIADSRTMPPQTSERIVTVRFDATVMKALPWRFQPSRKEMAVHLGETVLAFYTAENLGGEAIDGQATFNVTPAKAGRYFNKIECFCFTRQTLKAGEKIEMPVSFYVDPALALDGDTEEITTITLSYTFFRSDDSKGRDGHP